MRFSESTFVKHVRGTSSVFSRMSVCACPSTACLSGSFNLRSTGARVREFGRYNLH